MKAPQVNVQQLGLEPADDGDFEALLALRIAAMREGLERLGRFDPARVRERLGRSFSPANTRHILLDGQRVGFMAVTRGESMWRLDHLYVDPACAAQGIGGWALGRILGEADAEGVAVALTALKRSDANRFYERHGFRRIDENDWDVHYLRPAQNRSPRQES
ncbi:acetyltransferase (GNAT) family protein [Sphaerotilus hippei]|uniref:Acetyltransferase (GNAT) family protein n=1 Tax=Sphaerotilus hippei TaxID=744406 RepID=A0A318H6R7_9BURK|nr:GNAT family N-acetyltransferase [Sphaerotilus hippei]PXW93304.1 acetyltransferase (GNAT) family protein [Sphaerotilus hippei]